VQGVRSLVFPALPQWRVIAADPPKFAEDVPVISPIFRRPGGSDRPGSRAFLRMPLWYTEFNTRQRSQVTLFNCNVLLPRWPHRDKNHQKRLACKWIKVGFLSDILLTCVGYQ
jgi:hypothetical protein